MRSWLILLPLVSAACFPSAKVKVLKPAAVDIPHHVRTVGVLDRSGPKNVGQAVLSTLEGAATGEGILADRQAAEAALEALEAVLRESPRFEVVTLQVDKKARKSSVWDKELSSSDVKKLCGKRCDGIVSLEAFDSDEGGLSAVEEASRGETVDAALDPRQDIVASWRFYEAKNGRIVDAHREERSGGSWIPDTEVGDGRSLVERLAIESGTAYGQRVAAHYVWEGRRLMGGEGLGTGNRRARAGDWAGAERAWRTVAESGDARAEAKARFNLAVAAEAKGDLERAGKLARQADRALNNGKSGRLVALMQDRAREQRKVEAQLRTPEPAAKVATSTRTKAALPARAGK
jgi:hypothetical protein